jgi:hypothetical protein
LTSSSITSPENADRLRRSPQPTSAAATVATALRAFGAPGLEFSRFRTDVRIRHWLRLAIAACGLGLGLVATLYPHWWHVGRWLRFLHHLRNPAVLSLAGFLLWYAAIDRRGDPFRFVRRALVDLLATWKVSDWRRRSFFLIATCNLIMLLFHASRYPQLLYQDRENQQFAAAAPQAAPGRRRVSSIEHFARQVVAETPADARILYQGRTAVMRLAFEVYPRRVFMLPQDFRTMATQWHVQPWLRNPPVDRHEPYWHQFIPIVNADPEAFIREHAITYVARFDEMDSSQCQLERVP